MDAVVITMSGAGVSLAAAVPVYIACGCYKSVFTKDDAVNAQKLLETQKAEAITSHIISVYKALISFNDNEKEASEIGILVRGHSSSIDSMILKKRRIEWLRLLSTCLTCLQGAFPAIFALLIFWATSIASYGGIVDPEKGSISTNVIEWVPILCAWAAPWLWIILTVFLKSMLNNKRSNI